MPQESKPVSIPTDHEESSISYKFTSKDDFKNKMLPLYRKVLSENGLNPEFAKSLVAQDVLESAWGSKPSGDNNFGGVKSRKDKNGNPIDPHTILKTREVLNGRDKYLDEPFRNFSSLEDYARYKVNLLNGKRYKAFSGSVSDFSTRVSKGGYATDPRYKDVLDKVIKSVKRGGILKAKSGVPLRNEFSTPGDWYDYSGSDYIPSGDEHWPSRNPKTGLLLKHPNHDTYYEMLKSEKKLGYKLYEDAHGREYSFNELERMTKGLAPWFKEKPYPNDLFTRDAKVLYGPKLSLAKRYYNKLKSIGAGDVQAAAMVGVFMQESSLDHSKISSNNAKGIAQLLGSKYDDYKLWLSKTGKSDTADSQIEWVWDHMSFGKDHWHDYYMSLLRHSLNDFADYKNSNDRDKYRSDWAKMKDSKFAEYNYEAFRDDFYNMSDPGDAAELFTWTFERPGEDEANIDQRRRYANAIYEYMTN